MSDTDRMAGFARISQSWFQRAGRVWEALPEWSQIVASGQRLADQINQSPAASAALLRAKQATQKVRRHTRLHHIFVAIAVFNIVVVGIALFIGHRLSQTLVRSGGIQNAFTLQFDRIDAVRQSVGNTVSFGRDNLGTQAAAGVADSYKRAADAVTTEITTLVAGLREFARGHEAVLTPQGRLTRTLESTLGVEQTGRHVINVAGTMLDRSGEPSTSNIQSNLAVLNAAHDRFMGEIDAVARTLRNANFDWHASNTIASRSFPSVGPFMGLMMILMMLAAAIYGRTLQAVLQKRRGDLKAALRSAHRAMATSRALNIDKTKLDTELLDKTQKLKEAQDEIGRKGRLAQLGQLTATVAHEIRNPLGAIRTAAYLVERKIKDKGLGLENAMQRISTGVVRCDKIISELLDFTRSKALMMKTLPVDNWVKTIVDEESRNLPGIVQFSFDLTAGDMEASFDEDRMRRVLINLLSNASEAMVGRADDATKVVTETPSITVSSRRIGEIIELAVTDSGPGISAENLAKVMEPLFTTKSFGVGLGLPAVEKILQQHGGGLKIASKVGEGATFTAWFPLAQSERVAA